MRGFNKDGKFDGEWEFFYEDGEIVGY